MTDPFRKAYRPLSELEQQHVQEIKDTASALWAILDDPQRPPSRERSLAKSKLEEAVMWAVKAVTA